MLAWNMLRESFIVCWVWSGAAKRLLVFAHGDGPRAHRHIDHAA